MSNSKYRACPHCGSKEFYTMGGESDEAWVMFSAAKKKSDGEYELLDGKALYGMPHICDECEFIQFFRV